MGHAKLTKETVYCLIKARGEGKGNGCGKGKGNKGGLNCSWVESGLIMKGECEEWVVWGLLGLKV